MVMAKVVMKASPASNTGSVHSSHMHAPPVLASTGSAVYVLMVLQSTLARGV